MSKIMSQLRTEPLDIIAKDDRRRYQYQAHQQTGAQNVVQNDAQIGLGAIGTAIERVGSSDDLCDALERSIGTEHILPAHHDIQVLVGAVEEALDGRGLDAYAVGVQLADRVVIRGEGKEVGFKLLHRGQVLGCQAVVARIVDKLNRDGRDGAFVLEGHGAGHPVVAGIANDGMPGM
jgi:hypothetical protein